jgi:hypothetical protein
MTAARVTVLIVTLAAMQYIRVRRVQYYAYPIVLRAVYAAARIWQLAEGGVS